MVLCPFALVLSGCNSEKPAKTTSVERPGEGEETVWLLTMQEEKNDQGEVISRITYTYDDGGLAVKKNMIAIPSRAGMTSLECMNSFFFPAMAWWILR